MKNLMQHLFLYVFLSSPEISRKKKHAYTHLAASSWAAIKTLNLVNFTNLIKN